MEIKIQKFDSIIVVVINDSNDNIHNNNKSLSTQSPIIDPVVVIDPIQAPKNNEVLWKVSAACAGSWAMKSPTAVSVAAAPILLCCIIV